MFLSGMEESRQSEISVPSVDSNALELIILYMYSGKLNITGENVIALLDASNLLEMVVRWELEYMLQDNTKCLM